MRIGCRVYRYSRGMVNGRCERCLKPVLGTLSSIGTRALELLRHKLLSALRLRGSERGTRAIVVHQSRAGRSEGTIAAVAVDIKLVAIDSTIDAAMNTAAVSTASINTGVVGTTGKGRSAAKNAVLVSGEAGMRGTGSDLALRAIDRGDLTAREVAIDPTAQAAVGTADLAIGARTVAVVILRDLGLDATTIRSGANTWQQRANNLDQAMLHVCGGKVQSCLDDVVGVVVAQKAIHLTRGNKLLDDEVLRCVIRATQALLDDVRAELVARQPTNAATELSDDGLSVVRFAEVNDVLNNIVAERILDEGHSTLGNLLDQPGLLVTRGMVDAALKDTATVTMSADIDTMIADGVEDELSLG